MNIPARYSFPYLAIATLPLALSACCATGERLDAEKLTLLRPGQANTQMIREALGPPKQEWVTHGQLDCELHLEYGPEKADYDLVVNTGGRLVSFARILHTGTLFGVDPAAPPYVWNEPIPLVDARKLEGLRVGASTHSQVTALLGAARRADVLDVGGFRIVWGPQEDDWVFEFYADGILAGAPEHRVRPQLAHAIGVR